LRLINFFVVVFILCFCNFCGNAQQYNFIKYSTQEGLPNSKVSHILQDSKAYLWVATQGGGLGKFDGEKFKSLSTKDGLPSNFINTIFEDTNRTLWFGTQKGLSNYKHEKIWGSYFEDRTINSIAAKNDTVLYLGTDKGLYLFNINSTEAEKYRVDSKLNITSVNAILQIGQELWVATTKGLFIIKAETLTIIDQQQGLLSDNVQSLTLDGKGQVWISQLSGGISCIQATSKNILFAYSDRKLKHTQNIFFDKEQNLWAATKDNGIQLLKKGSQEWIIISEAQGLANKNVQSIISDSWGNIWIGTAGGGLNKFLGQYFTYYNSDTGLNGNRIYAIMEDSRNTLWVSVDDKGVSTIDSTGIQTDVDGSYISSKCNHIMEDYLGRLWMSTDGEGLVMKDSVEYWVFNELDGLPSSWIKTTAQDTFGTIWVGTYANGLGRIVTADSMGIKVELYDTTSGLPDLFITVLAKDRSGKVWFGTKQGGLGYIDNQSIVTLSNKSVLPKSEIRSITFDQNSQPWIGVAGRGIFQGISTADTFKFNKFEGNASLKSNNIYQLIFDQENNLWVGTELGLDKVIFKQDEYQDIQHYGRNEGFLGIEATHNAVTLDHNGHLWFGTRNGLSKHKPGNTQLKTAAPKIHFTGVSLMYEPIQNTAYADYLVAGDSLAEGSAFKYNQNNIGFLFKAINLDYPEDLTYSWKLDGFNDTWSPISNAASANFTNLSPGKYHFLVKATNVSGLESKVIGSTFEIHPAFWQSIWFQMAVILLLCLLAYLYFRSRINKVRKREATRRAQLELENELLGLEQKALQLQMNPHFIFNALNSIQSVVVNQKTDIARDQIQNFAGLMRGILSNSKKSSITLQEEFNTIDKYLKLEQFCQTKAFDFEIELPIEYDPEEIEIPPMMIQPFVENAVFHGVSHLEDKGYIKVIFEIRNELLACTIIDNGVGRQKAASMGKNKTGHQSTAIAVTQQRLEGLRGQQNYQAFIVEDVLNEAQEVRGTKVSLQMPLKLTF